MRRLLLVGILAAAVACGSPVHAGAPNGSITTAAVQAMAEQTFPLVPAYGYYGVCGLTGDVSGCPYTPRLKARLAELKATLCRCRNPAPTLQVTATVTGANTGVAHVKYGSETFDLAAVRQNGQVLVDDETCAGRRSTSIYETLVAC
ncbi:MAG TPA: hypothetical protein VF134_09150 [Candidatus Dormibacteraeota bacterium]